MAILRVILVVALAVVVAATGASAKTCYFKDPCSRSRLLSGWPGDFVVDACGNEMVFSPTCLARRISACKIKDPCPKRAVATMRNTQEGIKKGTKHGPGAPLIPFSFRGNVVNDGCNRPYRVSPICKLIKISEACYKACFVAPIKVGRRTVLRPGRPFTCASRCR